MKNKKLKYKYLLGQFSKVNDFLGSENNEKEDIPDIIVSFCIVTEKILKITLHNKNPVLVFDIAQCKSDDAISTIVLELEKEINTITIETVLKRFSIVFKEQFSENDLQAIIDIFHARNYFVHSYKPDDRKEFDEDDIINKMGTIWEKIIKMAILLFGKDHINNRKPKKKYSEAELEKVLEDEVRKLLKNSQQKIYDYSAQVTTFSDILTSINLQGEKCPRCDAFSFQQGDELGAFGVSNSMMIYPPISGDSSLYKCRRCNLELTEKQYEIAKRIKNII